MQTMLSAKERKAHLTPLGMTHTLQEQEDKKRIKLFPDDHSFELHPRCGQDIIPGGHFSAIPIEQCD
jgi:hypothetical protein